MVREITNPYIAGSPLHTKDVFYGRHDVFASIKLKLRGRFQDNLIFLCGQRRTGKTSILLQIQNEDQLGPEYSPVYVNLQGMGLTRQGMSGLLYDVAVEICQVVGTDSPRPDEFAEDPQTFLRHICLPSVLNKIGNKHLLLLFDEYETLGERIGSGTLEETIFHFLRTLMAGEPNISFIFAGSHTPAELGGYYLATFGRTLVQGIRVSFLGEYDAIQLITEPVAGLMRYDSQAVEMIFQLTSGQPFFIQLLCQNLFGHLAPAMRTLPEGEEVPVTREDVEEILDQTIASGENQLQEIWTEYFSPKEKAVLAGASVALNSAGTSGSFVPSVPRADIDTELSRSNADFEEGEITQILEVLTSEKETLKRDPGSLQFRFAVDLLRKWISNSQDLRDLASKLPISGGRAGQEEGPLGWTRAAKKTTALVVMGFILTTVCGAGWGLRRLWLPLIQPATPIAIARITPTVTVTPSRTLTYTPTATPRPTNTPTSTPTPTYTPTAAPTPKPTNTPTSTPTSVLIRPQLVAPAQGDEHGSPIIFQWSGHLGAGQTYLVTAYHPRSGYAVQRVRLTSNDCTLPLPKERYGEWRWYVSVVRGGSELITSSEWMFWFNPGSSGPSRPSPTEPLHD